MQWSLDARHQDSFTQNAKIHVDSAQLPRAWFDYDRNCYYVYSFMIPTTGWVEYFTLVIGATVYEDVAVF